jgi:hypothetical protein
MRVGMALKGAALAPGAINGAGNPLDGAIKVPVSTL